MIRNRASIEIKHEEKEICMVSEFSMAKNKSCLNNDRDSENANNLLVNTLKILIAAVELVIKISNRVLPIISTLSIPYTSGSFC